MIFFIALGFLFVKLKVLSSKDAKILSILENDLCLPATLVSAFMTNFTIKNIKEYGRLMLISIILYFFFIGIGYFLSRLFGKSKFEKNFIHYGFICSNFGFVGYPLMQAVFPDYYMEYILFTMPMQLLNYTVIVPSLLMDNDDDGENKKITIGDRLKRLCNPMVFGMLFGICYGLIREQIGFETPSLVMDIISGANGLMAPLAMFLTGMVVAGTDLKKNFSEWNVYAVSATRLLLIPAVVIGLASLMKIFLPNVLSDTAFLCVSMVSCLPLGINVVIIPTAYGKDTSKPATIVFLTHVLCLITVPIVLMIVCNILGI